VDFQYYTEEKKRIPKNSRLNSDIIVKYTEATRTASSLTHGKRIFICGTTENNSLFFAIYNTVFNITEYVYEDPLEENILTESCKDIHINLDTGHLIIVSNRKVTDGSSREKELFIRGFSLESTIKNNFRNGY